MHQLVKMKKSMERPPRDYLHVKVWNLNMENRPVETYCVHDYLRNKLFIIYENDCIDFFWSLTVLFN